MALTKLQAKENLQKLIEKFNKESDLGHIKEYNEEATKTAFIQPLLKDVLGWDVNDRNEVSPEEKISRGRVDYGLKIEGKTKIFVEAKPPKADLDKHIEQAVKYGYNRKGVPFVLLTDFEGIKLFDVTVKPDSRNPKKGLKLNLFYYRYELDFDKLWLLSKESVVNGELDKLLLEKPKDRIPVDKAILDDLKRWREDLAKDIYKNNPNLFINTTEAQRHKDSQRINSVSSVTPSLGGESFRDADYLKEITQRILDRIIFMRSCEDRGLIHRTPLKVFFEEHTDTLGTNTMVFLKEEFKHYNIIFDSDLFSPKDWEKDLQIDFRVMNKIVMDTYNPYQFDVIPLEVLGNIYEQYLGYTIRLTPQQVKYELKPDVRKAGGVYYTPEYIVDYIVKNTVGKLLKESSADSPLSLRGAKRRGNLTSKKIKKLRILDPACGSGSFLIRAYEEMLNYYKEQKKKLKPRMNTDKHRIITSPLTGEGKGEGESFSLSLREAERRGNLTTEPIQSELDLKHEDTEIRLTIHEKAEILKNHIFGVDIDEQAVEVTKLSLMLKMLEGEFGIIPGRNILPMLDKNIRCGNSLISGSPLELKKYFGDDYYKVKPFNWEQEFKEIMDDGGFDIVIGNPPYVVVKGGRYTGFEESKEIINYYKEKYKHVQQQINIYVAFLELSYNVLKMDRYGGMIVPNTLLTNDYCEAIRQFFLRNSQIIYLNNEGLVFENAVVEGLIIIYRKGFRNRNKISTKYAGVINHIEQNALSDFYRSRFLIHLTEISINLISKYLRNTQKLTNICEVWRGLTTGNDSKFLNRKKLNQKYKKVIQGKQVHRYYIEDDELYVLYDTSQLDRARPPRIFEIEEKLVSKFVGKDLAFSYDDMKLYALNTTCVIFPYPHTSENIKYILGLLNSKLLNFYFRQVFTDYRDTFPIVKSGHLEQLPIHTIDFSKPSDKKLHDNLVALVDVMLDLNKKIQSAKGSAKDQIQREITKTDDVIDGIVYKLYNITDEERKIIEGS